MRCLSEIPPEMVPRVIPIDDASLLFGCSWTAADLFRFHASATFSLKAFHTPEGLPNVDRMGQRAVYLKLKPDK